MDLKTKILFLESDDDKYIKQSNYYCRFNYINLNDLKTFFFYRLSQSMGSLARKAIGGSIHKIREFELEKVSEILVLNDKRIP